MDVAFAALAIGSIELRSSERKEILARRKRLVRRLIDMRLLRLVRMRPSASHRYETPGAEVCVCHPR
jgi:hypothetical protein